MSTSRVGLVGTLVFHCSLFAGAFWVSRTVTEPVQMVHAITLIAAPAPAESPIAETVKTPPVVKSGPVAPILKPKKTPDKVKPAPKKPPVTQKTPPVVTPSVETPAPGVTPSIGQDVTSVKIDGFASKHPEYIEKIYNCILGPWMKVPRAANETEVMFVIHHDGSVTDIKTARASNNRDFDSQARTTIELVSKPAPQLGRSSSCFGVLPDSLSEMPVSFTFKPVKP